MIIAIASDHAGFCLKEDIKKALPQIEWTDFGAFSKDSVDYPDTGYPAAKAVAEGTCDKGILICGSGIGMSIVANRIPGIRAALCNTVEIAKLSRLHNDANILVLAGRFSPTPLALEIVNTWLDTDFEGGRHQTRLNKIV
ncbi:MAG: ribose 5-phosphate isomerase B [Candidatus Cloacimonetes bacterium]|nr:ribose 5-phosphate isomerase B [Candidatus Cloacimonadota bacterium]